MHVDVVCKWPGRVGDARQFETSKVYKGICEGVLLPENNSVNVAVVLPSVLI